MSRATMNVPTQERTSLDAETLNAQALPSCWPLDPGDGRGGSVGMGIERHPCPLDV